MAVSGPIIIKIGKEDCYPIKVTKKSQIPIPCFDNSYIDPVTVCEVKLELNESSNDSYHSNDEDIHTILYDNSIQGSQEVYNECVNASDSYAHTEGQSDCKFRCYVCGKDYSSKDAVMLHYRTHVKSKLFECYICSKRCQNHRSLSKHIICHLESPEHQKKKPSIEHPCPICEKSFKDKTYLLKVHMNIHTKQRPYACEICGNRFKDPRARDKHSMIHSGIKPHKCHICLKRFLRKGDLKLHLHFHTNERPYSCPVCERTYQSTSGYFKHMRRQHNQMHNIKTGDNE